MKSKSTPKHELENQYTLNALLKLSTSEAPLNDLLEQCLKTILSLSWLQLLEKAAVLLLDKDTQALVLTASVEVTPNLHPVCARVEKGHCLCGKAVMSKQVQYASGSCQNNNFLLQNEMLHGNYVVPLFDQNNDSIGVLTLYLGHGHKKNEAEIQVLTAVAAIMSSLILRKQAEEETLKIQNELCATQLAFDEHAIIVFTDLKGTILQANDNFCKTSQYSREELIGKNHRIINSGHHPRSFFASMLKTIHAGNIWRGEVKNKRKDGSFYWLSATIVPMRDASGKIERFMAMRTDITALKNYEGSLEQSNRLHKKRICELETLKSKLQRKQQEIEKIAYFDTLTGLPNRAHCRKDLSDKFSKLSGENEFAVIQIDLDKLKRVNDTLGHSAGDKLLKTLGSRLSILAGEIEDFTCYRWGGDEFVAVVGYNECTDFSEVCNRISALVSLPVQVGSATLHPTISMGIAQYPKDATTFDDLMIFSDLALYKTKELGRNGHSFFTPAMKSKIDREAELELEIRTALKQEQFELYFQPQINVKSGSITGFEALIRWNHPERGLLAPGDFLSVAEYSGLAPELGRVVFQQAMAAIQKWLNEGLAFGRLAVNLSPRHLAQGTVVQDLLSQMKKYGVAPHYVGIELLESYLLDDPNANIQSTLKYLVNRGVYVELDDFGTGYASLSHLSNLPISGLKIDRAFIEKCDKGPQDRAIVSALISMAKLMKLRVVCEGLETQAQIQAISQIGECSIQGYYISRPMTFENATSWIKSYSSSNLLHSEDFSQGKILKSG